MTDADKPYFAQIWTACWTMYSKSVNPTVLSLAFNCLKQFSLDEIELGLTRHLQSPDVGQYFPKPADIIKHIEGNSQDRALHAWSIVERTIRNIGSWYSVVFDDPIIHLVIYELGGWIALCEIKSTDSPFVQKDFIARYQRVLVRHERLNFCPYLMGRIDKLNAQQSINSYSIVLIGDINKAKEILYSGSINSPLMVDSTFFHHISASEMNYFIEGTAK